MNITTLRPSQNRQLHNNPQLPIRKNTCVQNKKCLQMQFCPHCLFIFTVLIYYNMDNEILLSRFCFWSSSSSNTFDAGLENWWIAWMRFYFE